MLQKNTDQKFKATTPNEQLWNENVSYNFDNICPENGHGSDLLEDHERKMD